MPFTERKLCSLEVILDICHRDIDEIYTQVFILQCGETLTKTKLIDGTCQWVERHPLLHATVEIRADGKYFVPFSIPDAIPSVIHWHDDVVDWVRLAEEDVQKPIDSRGGPLWRMHFAPISDGRRMMLFTANHCILDARSFVFIYLELLTILNGKGEQLGPPKSLLPSMDKLLFNQDVFDGEEPLLNEPWAIEGRLLPRSFTDHGVGKGTTRVIPMVFVHERTARLFEESRRHGVKITSTCSSIASLALAELMNKYGEAVPDSFQFAIAVSLRSHLNIDLNEMGAYVTSMNCRTVLQPNTGEDREQFWRAAKATNDELHERLDSGEAVENVKLESCALQVLLNEEHPPDSAYFFTSSLGSYSYREGEADAGASLAVKLDEAHFCLSLLEEGWLPPLLHALTTLNGRLFWTFSYQDRAFKSSLAEEYCRRIEAITDWLLSDQPRAV